MAELESSKPKHYKELIVWQKGMELAKAVYRLTAVFSGEEKYGLATQMRRAAVAIPSNIAEGQARYGTREFIYFFVESEWLARRIGKSIVALGRFGLLQTSRNYRDRTGDWRTVKNVGGDPAQTPGRLATSH